MCGKWKMLIAVLAVCSSCLFAGCGGGGSSSPSSNNSNQQASMEKTNNDGQSQKDEQKPKQSSDNTTKKTDMSLGIPVTSEMIQAYESSVTEEEMSLFTNIAKHPKLRYTETQVRDIAARMKMVGIDFSMLENGEVTGDILRQGFSFKIKNMTDEEKFSFAYGHHVFVQLQKDDKSKVVAIDLSMKESNVPFDPFYKLYKNDRIIGDFSDVVITSETKGIIVEKIQEYVSTLGGNIQKFDHRGTLDIKIGSAFLTITKDALSEESEWKGEDSKQFRFPIISVWVRYNAPSEVYGVKEQQKRERFLFNKNGEFLIVVPEVIPEQKKSHYNNLLTEALKNVKL